MGKRILFLLSLIVCNVGFAEPIRTAKVDLKFNMAYSEGETIDFSSCPATVDIEINPSYGSDIIDSGSTVVECSGYKKSPGRMAKINLSLQLLLITYAPSPEHYISGAKVFIIDAEYGRAIPSKLDEPARTSATLILKQDATQASAEINPWGLVYDNNGVRDLDYYYTKIDLSDE